MPIPMLKWEHSPYLSTELQALIENLGDIANRPLQLDNVLIRTRVRTRGFGMSGVAYYRLGLGGTARVSKYDAASLISIKIPAEPYKNTRFPKIVCYPKLANAPRILVKNWAEDILLLLAHELFHIKQYTDRGPKGAGAEGERECEHYSAMVLEAFTKEKRVQNAE